MVSTKLCEQEKPWQQVAPTQEVTASRICLFLWTSAPVQIWANSSCVRMRPQAKSTKKDKKKNIEQLAPGCSLSYSLKSLTKTCLINAFKAWMTSGVRAQATGEFNRNRYLFSRSLGTHLWHLKENYIPAVDSYREMQRA